MAMPDFFSLLSVGHSPSVYAYDPERRTTSIPSPAQLSWPAEYVLNFHKKHVFPGTKPSLHKISSGINNWFNRVNWQLVLSGKPDDYKYWRLHSRHNPPQCSVPDHLDDAVKAHRHVLSSVWSLCQTTLLRKSMFSYESRFNPVIRWGLNILRRGQWGFLLSDKDGTFVLLPRQSVVKMKEEILNSPEYMRSYLSMEIIHEYCSDYGEICQYVAESVHSPSGSLEHCCIIRLHGQNTQGPSLYCTKGYSCSPQAPVYAGNAVVCSNPSVLDEGFHTPSTGQQPLH